MQKQQWTKNGRSSKSSGLANDQGKEQKEGHPGSTEGQRTVHFATPMDICHLENAELEPKCQLYKGWVVLRGDIAGSYAVFTEQGSSASQMTAAKVMDVIARLRDCAG